MEIRKLEEGTGGWGRRQETELWRQGRKRDTGDRVKATGDGRQGTGKGREQGTAN